MLVMSTSVFAQQKNRVGFDLGGYAVSAPKKILSGNGRNQFIAGGSSFRGIFYDRAICNNMYSVKTGVYISKQFDALMSVHIPVEFNGSIFGKRDSTMGFFGYSAGLGFNYGFDVDKGIYLLGEGTHAIDVEWNKKFYIAPQIGFNAGLNVWRISVLCSATMSFWVPEFAKFTTTFTENGEQLTQTNTNSNMGISLKLGLAYRF